MTVSSLNSVETVTRSESNLLASKRRYKRRLTVAILDPFCTSFRGLVTIMTHTLQVDRSILNVVPELICILQQQQMAATVSFDLQVARADQVRCVCPYHDTAECSCQYLILLVQDQSQPSPQIQAITLHGRDNITWLSLCKQNAVLSNNNPEIKLLETKLLRIIFSLAAKPKADSGL